MAHDPGGRVRLALSEGTLSRVLFSRDPEQTRRFLLERRTPGTPINAPAALWIGMNPSTADATADDPTVQREWRATRERLGLQRYLKANIIPYRATKPRDMRRAADHESYRAENLRQILWAARQSERIILAFGVMPKLFQPYIQEIYAALRERNSPTKIECLGVTRAGWPRHPLYLRSDAPFVEWEPIS